MIPRPALLATLVVVATAQAAAATGQQLAYSGTFQLTSGDYIFTEPTRTLSLYNGLTLTAGPLRLGASLPLILQNTGAITVVGGTYLPTGGEHSGEVGGRQQGERVPMGPGGRQHVLLSPAGPSAAVDGADVATGTALQETDSLVHEPGSYDFAVGDPFFSAGLELYQGSGFLRSIELTGSAKAPLNDIQSGVGTGEWDWSLGAAAATAVGPVLAFLDVAWWWYGDLPELELRDGVSWGGGLGLPLTRRVWVSAMATFTNRIIATAEAARTTSLGLSYRLGDAGTLSFMAGAGLTETSPDFTLSLGWRRSVVGP